MTLSYILPKIFSVDPFKAFFPITGIQLFDIIFSGKSLSFKGSFLASTILSALDPADSECVREDKASS